MKIFSFIVILFGIFFLSACQHTNTTDPKEEHSHEHSSEGGWSVHVFESQWWEKIVVKPISHATAIVEWWDKVIYADPAQSLEWNKIPDVVFVSHEHGDHYNEEVLVEILERDTNVVFLSSQFVYDSLSPQLQENTVVMNNGDGFNTNGFNVTAIWAYNIREDALHFHPKWRGNGYIFERDGFRMYFSGDSEDTPEMRALSWIDVAFVSMNLPFTMSVDSAADAVAEFGPEYVFPYHYRGKDGLSDLESFEQMLTEKNPDVEVVLWDWY